MKQAYLSLSSRFGIKKAGARFSLSGQHAAETLHPVVLNASGSLCWQHLEAYFQFQYAAIRELPYVITYNAWKTSGDEERPWPDRRGKKKSVYFWSFGVRLRRCEKRHLRKYGQLSRRDSWVGVRVCKWACLLVVVFERHKNQQSATWVREPRPALELREKQRNEGMKWMEWGCRWTHTASGTVTQGKQCSGSHLAETGGGGGCGGAMGRRGQCGGVERGGKGCDEHKHMEKQIFPLPAAVSAGKCQHELHPRLTVLHSAPPPGSPCSATEYGQQWHCGAFPQGRGKHRGARAHPHACIYTNTSCTPCSFSHNGNTKKHAYFGREYY